MRNLSKNSFLIFREFSADKKLTGTIAMPSLLSVILASDNWYKSLNSEFAKYLSLVLLSALLIYRYGGLVKTKSYFLRLKILSP